MQQCNALSASLSGTPALTYRSRAGRSCTSRYSWSGRDREREGSEGMGRARRGRARHRAPSKEGKTVLPEIAVSLLTHCESGAGIDIFSFRSVDSLPQRPEARYFDKFCLISLRKRYFNEYLTNINGLSLRILYPIITFIMNILLKMLLVYIHYLHYHFVVFKFE